MFFTSLVVNQHPADSLYLRKAKGGPLKSACVDGRQVVGARRGASQRDHKGQQAHVAGYALQLLVDLLWVHGVQGAWGA